MVVPPASVTYQVGQAVPSPAGIRDAAQRLAPWVRRTPVVEWLAPLPQGVVPVVLKLEQLQYTGSFKPRGAFNCMLTAAERTQLVVAASGGNHGLAVGYAARALGIPAEVYVPKTAPAVKVAGIRATGAKTILAGASYAEAAEACQERAQTPRALYVHAYDGLPTLSGQGTVGLELDEQAPHLDTVLVAVGGGGLAGGIAAWYQDRVQLVAVEPTGCPTYHAAAAAGRPVDVAVGGLASDALGASRIGDSGFASLTSVRAQSVLVRAESIERARQLLWDDMRLVVEPGGATALAALLQGVYVPAAGEQVAVVVCGANADPADLTRLTAGVRPR